MKREYIDSVVSVVFLFLIFITFILNYKYIEFPVSLYVEEQEARVEKIENDFMENFVGKDVFISVYGVFQNMMKRNIIGNFEFIRENGIYNVKEYCHKSEMMIQEIEKVKYIADKYNTSFLYIQKPIKEQQISDEGILTFLDEYKCSEIIVNTLKEDGVSVLDERELVLDEPTFDYKNMFFYTDGHLNTETEIWSANILADYLINNANVKLNDLHYLGCEENDFLFEAYYFLGGYVQSLGEYYAGLEEFIQFKPKFETDFTVTNNVYNTSENGTFEEVIMNGYEYKTDESFYWVTNYLNYGWPYYTVTNNKQTTGDILFITDSMSYRTISLLALTAHEITILDPRFFGGVDYINQAMATKKYDIVIVSQGVFLFAFDNDFSIVE